MDSSQETSMIAIREGSCRREKESGRERGARLPEVLFPNDGSRFLLVDPKDWREKSHLPDELGFQAAIIPKQHIHSLAASWKSKSAQRWSLNLSYRWYNSDPSATIWPRGKLLHSAPVAKMGKERRCWYAAGSVKNFASTAAWNQNICSWEAGGMYIRDNTILHPSALLKMEGPCKGSLSKAALPSYVLETGNYGNLGEKRAYFGIHVARGFSKMELDRTILHRRRTRLGLL